MDKSSDPLVLDKYKKEVHDRFSNDYRLDDNGVWEICGHAGVHLCYLDGSYKDVLDIVAHIKEFARPGHMGGSSIRKLLVYEVDDGFIDNIKCEVNNISSLIDEVVTKLNELNNIIDTKHNEMRDITNQRDKLRSDFADLKHKLAEIDIFTQAEESCTNQS